MKLVPLADRVVLKQLEAETKTKTGIILTSSAQEKPKEAEVVAVGPGTEDVKMEVSVGQKVIYSKYAGISLCFTMMYSSSSIFTFVPAYLDWYYSY